MKPAICIMSKNEVESIDRVIDEIKKLGMNFFVCDGHSSDGTAENARKKGATIFSQVGKGKGTGMREAMAWARQKGFDTIVFVDCDMTYPSERIPDLLAAINKDGYDMVVGRRDTSNIPLLHRLPNSFFNWLVRIFYGYKVWDMLSGLRAIRLKSLDERYLSANGFDIETEITVKAAKNNLRTVELPIAYHPRQGKSKIKKSDGFLILWRIVKERF